MATPRRQPVKSSPRRTLGEAFVPTAEKPDFQVPKPALDPPRLRKVQPPIGDNELKGPCRNAIERKQAYMHSTIFQPSPREPSMNCQLYQATIIEQIRRLNQAARSPRDGRRVTMPSPADIKVSANVGHSVITWEKPTTTSSPIASASCTTSSPHSASNEAPDDYIRYPEKGDRLHFSPARKAVNRQKSCNAVALASPRERTYAASSDNPFRQSLRQRTQTSSSGNSSANKTRISASLRQDLVSSMSFTPRDRKLAEQSSGHRRLSLSPAEDTELAAVTTTAPSSVFSTPSCSRLQSPESSGWMSTLRRNTLRAERRHQDRHRPQTSESTTSFVVGGRVAELRRSAYTFTVVV